MAPCPELSTLTPVTTSAILKLYQQMAIHFFKNAPHRHTLIFNCFCRFAFAIFFQLLVNKSVANISRHLTLSHPSFVHCGSSCGSQLFIREDTGPFFKPVSLKSHVWRLKDSSASSSAANHEITAKSRNSGFNRGFLKKQVTQGITWKFCSWVTPYHL